MNIQKEENIRETRQIKCKRHLLRAFETISFLGEKKQKRKKRKNNCFVFPYSTCFVAVCLFKAVCQIDGLHIDSKSAQTLDIKSHRVSNVSHAVTHDNWPKFNSSFFIVTFSSFSSFQSTHKHTRVILTVHTNKNERKILSRRRSIVVS